MKRLQNDRQDIVKSVSVLQKGISKLMGDLNEKDNELKKTE